ncbi:lysophospholipid acyltransferase family protein [bacterium]|nr:lysophospholipid acyltransferase family protein [bacterium]
MASSDGSRAAKVKRRLKTIPIMYLLWLAMTLTLPLLFLIGLLVDAFRFAFRRVPFVAVRVIAFGWVYLTFEAFLVPVLFGCWLVAGFGRSHRMLDSSSYVLQAWWAGALFWTFRTLFGVALDVEGDEVVVPGPIILMLRHASIADVLLANVVVTRGRGIKLNYVFKRELLLDPAIDIAANRMDNHFVARSGGSTSEIAAIRALSADLDEHHGVLIYPEGTRFTSQKRQRAVAHLQKTRPDLGRRAMLFRHVLPPRLGGPITLLDPLTPADVVIVSHVGLDGVAEVKDFLGGAMVGTTLRVSFERFACDDVPDNTEGRIAWLFDRWTEVDNWIHEAGGHS